MYDGSFDLFILLGFISIYAFCFYLFFLTESLLYSVITFVILQLVFIYYVFYI